MNNQTMMKSTLTGWPASRTAITAAVLLLTSVAGVNAADDASWTGFYIGAHVGAGFGTMDLSSDTSAAVKQNLLDHTANGSLTGLQGGANWQFKKHLLVGFEADHSITDIGETAQVEFGPNGGPGVGNKISVETDVNYIQTFRARIGYAAGPSLFFVTGGQSYMHHSGSGRATLNGAYAAGTDDGFHTGHVVGGGYERRLTDKLSIKGEYLRLISGTENYVIDLTAAAAQGGTVQLIGLEYRANLVQFGVNFHF